MTGKSLSQPSVWLDARMVNMSGIGRYLAEIIPTLSKSVNLTCIVGDGGVNFMQTHGINYKICNAKIYSINEQWLIPAIIEPCDLFWSPHFNIPLLPIRAKNRMVTIHDAYHLAFIKDLSIKERLYAKLVFRMALQLSKVVVTVSEFSKKELVKYTSSSFSEKIQVILNGVTAFPRSKANKEKPTNRRYLLYVGNVKPHKNLKNAVLAFRQFCIAYPDTNFGFKIVGQKGGFINSDSKVDAVLNSDDVIKGKVEFTGFVDDAELTELYENAHCLIFPSFYEGFGLPPLESMKLGTPAIVSNRASMPELCGDCVLYFDPADINSIFLSIQSIVFDESIYNALKFKGEEHVKRYNWRHSAELHTEIILRNAL